MTIDAVGGVWRYAMDLAAGLREQGIVVVFAGLGPKPSAAQHQEAEALGRLCWLDDAALDWMVEEESALANVGALLADMAAQENVDLLHLNLPSQANGLDTALPVVVVSHSCVVTWFSGVRKSPVPESWRWHFTINRNGFDRASVVVAPSRSHADMLENAYGKIDHLKVVHNASRTPFSSGNKENLVLAAGRWWDDGKNGRVVDEAAERLHWPLVMAGSNQGPSGQYLPIRHAMHRGELSHEAVMALMKRSAIFVSPSLYEPFGLAPLEAARTGNALVLADIPTYRELWEGCALFVDPQDAEAFATAINRLCDDAALRSELSEKASARSAAFGPEPQAEAMASVYADLLRHKMTLTAAE
ncbi:glycosyltransferase [Rhizobium deserti]|uniref:Glycosyltransferase n=1 Tax=Rhizobium deserti TaxID=2547961 RepID=A0A4R5UGE1_9HYPH|nr:glycosyltransferase family 4 protein [Rhizobium deserti]TDK34608.1 glycosyltransferase [Rhizobium deserti]